MRTKAAIASACAVLLAAWAIADESATGSNDVVAVTKMADGSPNTWTLADLQAALGLLNRKYHREVERAEGRRVWHGRLVSEIVDTNLLQKVEVYEDGSRFTFPFEIMDTPTAISNRNAQMRMTMKHGVPKALAAARQRRAKEKTTTNIVNVVAGPGAEAK